MSTEEWRGVVGHQTANRAEICKKRKKSRTIFRQLCDTKVVHKISGYTHLQGAKIKGQSQGVKHFESTMTEFSTVMQKTS